MRKKESAKGERSNGEREEEREKERERERERERFAGAVQLKFHEMVAVSFQSAVVQGRKDRLFRSVQQ